MIQTMREFVGSGSLRLKSKSQICWLILIAVLAMLALLPVVAWGAARLLVVRTPPSHADAIVMMSGSATFRERTQHAAELYKQGRASQIVLTNDGLPSGWSQTQQRNPLYYERARDELIRLGVPAASISVIEDPILGTYDEAVVIKLYAESHNLHSIVVVTSGYHSRRALWTFHRVFADSNIQIGM